MPEKLKPVCHRAFFLSAPQHWGPCSKEHHDMVKANPKEWPDYEVQELYVLPANHVVLPRDLLERIAHDDEGMSDLADFEELKRLLRLQQP
ncbi:hypothetical protein OFL75_19145 [Pseudomonas aeruginosa]|jgi:hypothetical protein|uniref:Uncharacterized protein n=3 Tax=Pseudomonas TaxID=286 RepID=A0A2Z1CBB2_PSEPU|nr:MULTISPECIES: hypothetical protein [Pseudomonas]MCP8473007.1 hypothetical protein [Pseudomonas triclosanedens]AGL46368.1 hypothetical protein pOZ176_409 [Pseudomonas aeruginosa PA96]ALZ46293.1 Hypothetical protein [Pseudomonas putida]EIW4149467.1 hypothetical protein [Pseudomonas aeruginosa]EKU5857683.1 hypothetical protein [Pseudomonas aeruginosa]